MEDHNLEVEVKFFLDDPAGFEKRLRSIGANLVQPRTHELNYRFDTPDLTLTRTRQVLRLRQDQAVVVTYKGPALQGQAVSMRKEIELEVNNFQAAKDLFEALGYQVAVLYEKYRTVYTLNELEITLDEMPFGVFTEIEGGDAQTIERMAASLSLLWSQRILESYLMLFERVKQNRGLKLQNLTFDEFKGMSVSAPDLGVKAADVTTYL